MKKNVLCMILAAALLCAVLLSGCGGERAQTEAPTDGPVTLWIITEKTNSTGMNDQAKAIIRAFEEKHEGVTVELEVLPQRRAEREARLEQLRTRIMAGDGPDGYLLPTSMWNGGDSEIMMGVCGFDSIAFCSDAFWFSTDVGSVWAEKLEPVFPNLDSAMRTGLFADLSEYYDADAELETQALQQTVMDAGVLDGARYVLPLRYERAVVYADGAQLAEAGLDQEKMASGLYGLWDELMPSESISWRRPARYNLGARDWQLLPQVFDYDQEEIILEKAVLRTFLERFQKMQYAIGNRILVDGVNFDAFWSDRSFLTKAAPIEIGTLDMALTAAAAAKSEKRELVMFPLPGVDGSFTARITYFAAAGAGGEHVALTYAFLREFLTQDAQWQQSRGAMGAKVRTLLERGWPVRTEGSVEPLWKYMQKVCTYRDGPKLGVSNTSHMRLKGLELEQNDIPVLDAPIDRAYFDNDALENLIDGYLTRLNNRGRDDEPLDVDLDQMVENIFVELEQYLAEG